MADKRDRQVVRRPTLEDVAALAGVSRAMASIVFRAAAGSRPETRERVFAAAAEIGYRPDTRARLLAGNGQLGVVFGMAGRFHSELLDGLYVAAQEAGHELILSALTPSRDEATAVATLLDFRCGAVILLEPGLIGLSALSGRIPVTVVGWRTSDAAVDVIRASDGDGMRKAVEHLVGLGHLEIAHVDGGPGPEATARRRAYRGAMRAHGLDAQVRVVRGGDHLGAGVRATRELLAGASLPTAVIGYNDDVAVGVVESLAFAGVRVPDDVSVVGWDDSGLAGQFGIDLTTVRQDAAEMARLAVQRSIDRMRETPVPDRELVLPVSMVVRSSTAKAR